MKNISGYVCARNVIKHDYCVDLAIRSMAPVCDEIVACDSDSDDGTRDFLESLKSQVPQLRVINLPWPNPVNDPYCIIKWMNRVRAHLKYDCQFYLDADEVLNDDKMTYEVMRRWAENGWCGWFYRVNFIRNVRTIIPHDVVCGHKVARLGPTKLFMPADEPQPNGECDMRRMGRNHPSFVIYHLGFMRKQSVMVEKVKDVQNMFFGTWDRTIEKAVNEGKEYWHYVPWKDRCLTHDGRYPLIAHDWLKERGAL